MAQICKICNSPNRKEIDRKIVQGLNKTKIAREYGLSRDCVENHSQKHLTRQLCKAYQVKEISEGLNLLAEIENMLSKANKIFDRNYRKNKRTTDETALKALSESRQTIELLAKMSAYLHEARAMQLQQKEGSYETKRRKDDEALVEKAFRRLSIREIECWDLINRKMHGEFTGSIFKRLRPEDIEFPDNDVLEPDNVIVEGSELDVTDKPLKRIKRVFKNRANYKARNIEPEKLLPYSKKPVGTIY